MKEVRDDLLDIFTHTWFHIDCGHWALLSCLAHGIFVRCYRVDIEDETDLRLRFDVLDEVIYWVVRMTEASQSHFVRLNVAPIVLIPGGRCLLVLC
jgi:hypothetical protein